MSKAVLLLITGGFPCLDELQTNTEEQVAEVHECIVSVDTDEMKY